MLLASTYSIEILPLYCSAAELKSSGHTTSLLFLNYEFQKLQSTLPGG